MKLITTLICLVLANFLSAQIAIGKTSVDGNGILDFNEFKPEDISPTNGGKGIILPVVKITDMNTTIADGTLAMDYDSKIVKVYQDGQWVDLTDEGSFEEQLDGITPISTAAQINMSDDVGNGVVLGNTTSTAEGVLVLEATDKALILPKVYKPEENIKSPIAGTICYDTASDTLAIFDGKVWSYWK